MKDKKKITAVIGRIKSALKAGYDMLNQDGQLPEVEETDMPGLAIPIIRGLEKELAEVVENERFAGMSEEDILEQKTQEREQKIRNLREQAGEALKQMKPPLEDPKSELEDETDPGNTETVDTDPGLSLQQLHDMAAQLTNELKSLDVNSVEFAEKTKELAIVIESIDSQQV